MAPFWSQSDTRKAGEVSYVTLDRSKRDVAMMDSLFNNVSMFISNQIGEAFQGTWMMVVLWSGVHPYPHGSYSGADLLFQYYDTFVNKVGKHWWGGGGGGGQRGQRGQRGLSDQRWVTLI